MTVPSALARAHYTGNGSTSTFSTGFIFFNNADVNVVYTDSAGNQTIWVENNQYTLTGADTGAPGTVTAKPGFIPATGTQLTILRDMPFTQELNGDVLASYSAQDLEDEFDKIYMSMGQLKEVTDRALTSDQAATINGWTPVFAMVTDGTRRVLQVIDWTGGGTTKPAVGLYIGPTGLTPTLSLGVDIRGPAGATGPGTGDMLTTNNLSDVPNKAAGRTNLGVLDTSLTGVVAATARTNLGLGTAATTPSTNYPLLANNLSDLPSKPTARTNLGLGTAATLNVGNAASNVVQLDGSAKLPAVDGSQLTGIVSGQPIPSSTSFAVGTVMHLALSSAAAGVTNVPNLGTTSGDQLFMVSFNYASGVTVIHGSAAPVGTVAQSWKNVSGQAVTLSGGDQYAVGTFVRVS